MRSCCAAAGDVLFDLDDDDEDFVVVDTVLDGIAPGGANTHSISLYKQQFGRSLLTL